MKTPLLIQVYRTLRRGWKRMTPEAQRMLRGYVRSQKGEGGYCNAGGKVDAYYTQFGRVLECVFSPWKLMKGGWTLTVPERMRKDDVYGCFFQLLKDEMRLHKVHAIPTEKMTRMSTNAVCCILASQHQTGVEPQEELVRYLLERQDQTGGFYASEQAPIPDLLSTAVALFTLQLIGRECASASDFVNAHWTDEGAFLPTLLDDYSDVEYVFYGMMGIG